MRPQMVYQHGHGASGRKTSGDNLHRIQAAFAPESQLFLDSALAEAGVTAKVRRIVQTTIFSGHGRRAHQAAGWQHSNVTAF